MRINRVHSVSSDYRVLFIILLASMMLLGLMRFAAADDNIEEFNTSLPIIMVTYHEIPVTIINHTLIKDDISKEYVVHDPAKLTGESDYNFTTDYLPNGQYTFTVGARADDGALNTGTKTFTINHPGMAVWLIDPPVGIGKTPHYTITVGTQFAATCKYGVVSLITSCGENMSCIYDRTPNFFSDTGGKIEHKTDYDGSTVFTEMFVICKIADGLDEDPAMAYGSTSFRVGYQSTSPHIVSVNSSQNPVESAYDKTDNISVVTDSETVCKITGGNSAYPLSNTDRWFDGNNYTDFSSYSTTHNILMDYYFVPTIFTRIDFNYNISCINYAQFMAQQNYQVSYKLSNNIKIRQLTPQYVSSADITYEIATSIVVAGCNLKVNGIDKGAMDVNPSNPVDYTMSSDRLGLSDGLNSMVVTCTLQNSTTENFSVTVDNQIPSINISASGSSCGLSNINFRLNGDDGSSGSGIAYYAYSITGPDGLLVDWTNTTNTVISYTPSGGLKQGTYTVNAFAVDRAGLQSDPVPKDIVATLATDSSCDSTPPTAHITLVNSTGYQSVVNISCTDDRACIGSFDYAFIASGDSCDNATFESKSYGTDGLTTITEKGKVCVKVYDGNNNVGSAEMIMTLSKAECGNNNREDVPALDYYEMCDGTDLNGATCADFGSPRFKAGILKCTDSCEFNIDNCDRGAGYCGDNKINNFPNEQCDLNSWGNISKQSGEGCRQLGFSGGTLRCDNCQFNTSQCTPKILDPSPECGGGDTATIDKGEQCEETIPFNITCTAFDSFTGGDLSCASCMFDISKCTSPQPPSVCGDGNVTAGEDCEGNDTIACSDWSDVLTEGTAKCDSSCHYNISSCSVKPYCGDNKTDSGEQCDGTDLNVACTDFGSPRFLGGIIKCSDSCEFNIDNCDRGAGYCGDNKINNFPNEQCDLNSWGNISKQSDTGCRQLGFAGGTLRCDNCQFNTSQCTQKVTDQNPQCGGGDLAILDKGEQCEETIPFNITCTAFDSFTGGDLSCASCMFDISKCTSPQPPSRCGDGNVTAGEDCEGNDTIACSDWSDIFTEGTAKCIATRCIFNTSSCSVKPYCGDNKTDSGEQCDGTDLNGATCKSFGNPQFKGGTLKCNNGCEWDTSNCDAGQGYCGDNIINDFPNEQCDGSDWGKISKSTNTGCIQLGFSGGTLRCDSCGFNTTQCTPKVINSNPECGGSPATIDKGEQCEETIPFSVNCTAFDSFTGGDLSCASCMFDISKCTRPSPPSICGNGITEPGEQCDDNDTESIIKACTDFTGYEGGDAQCHNCQYDFANCTPAPVCGNNNLEPSEQCDGSRLRNMNCTLIDSFSGGVLGCYAKDSPQECTWDVSRCDEGKGYCGDNIINDFPNEDCDGNDWGNVSKQNNAGCRQLGFEGGGTLSCDGCRFDTSSCITAAGEGSCGDKTLNPGEECEPSIPLKVNCTSIDHFISGSLACTNECAFDLGDCKKPAEPVCGDGYIDGNEQCDSQTMGKLVNCTQVDSRYVSGTLSCDSECKIDLSQCQERSPVCGDAVISTGEMCDGSHMGSLKCTDFGFEGGTLRCDNTCQADTFDCYGAGGENSTQAICGNDIVEPGEQCDKTELGDTDWSTLLGCSDSSDVECSSQCKLRCKSIGGGGGLTVCANIDKQCGGDCAPCDVGDNCDVYSDCASLDCEHGICVESVEQPAENSTNTNNTSPTGCSSDPDCSPGKCVDGQCKYSNGLGIGLILIIIGLVLSLGGGGYIIYRSYFAVPVKKGLPPPMFGPNIPMHREQQPSMDAQHQKIAALQQQKVAQLREQKDQQRKDLLKDFDGTSKRPEEWSKIDEKPVKSKDEEYVDITDLKKKDNDVFSKLATIAGAGGPDAKAGAKPDTSRATIIKSEKPLAASASSQKDGVDDAKSATADINAQPTSAARKADDTATGATLSKSTKSKKKNSKSSGKGKTKNNAKPSDDAAKHAEDKSEAFEKLESMSQKYSKQELAKKLSELSGKEESKINSMLEKESITNNQATSLFQNLDREKLTSDVFKTILSSLIVSGRLSKDTVSGLLFDYMDKGELSRGDIAKIMSELKLI